MSCPYCNVTTKGWGPIIPTDDGTCVTCLRRKDDGKWVIVNEIRNEIRDAHGVMIINRFELDVIYCPFCGRRLREEG